MRILLTAMLLCLTLTAQASAQATGPDHKAVLMGVVRDHVIPRYARLSDAMGGQAKAWEAFCASPEEPRWTVLRGQFQDAADAWSGIEFMLYGPIGVDYRFERMAHWPERSNAVSRALAKLLAETGPPVTAERLAGASVAAQGLSALERLVFEPGAAAAFQEGAPGAARRCALGRAVAAALAATSRAVLEEWRGPGGTAESLAGGSAAMVDEALTRIVTESITSLEVIADKKLGAVMGASVDAVRSGLAEGWRSGRSMRAIAINLESDEALFRLLVATNRQDGESVSIALDTARRIAGSLSGDIGALASDPATRPRLVLLRDSVRSSRDLAEASLPAALGIVMGFNSRDGD